MSVSVLVVVLRLFVAVGRIAVVVAIALIVNVVERLVTEWADVLNVEPFAKTNAVKVMVASGNTSTGQILVADRAHVVEVA